MSFFDVSVFSKNSKAGRRRLFALILARLNVWDVRFESGLQFNDQSQHRPSTISFLRMGIAGPVVWSPWRTAESGIKPLCRSSSRHTWSTPSKLKTPLKSVHYRLYPLARFFHPFFRITYCITIEQIRRSWVCCLMNSVSLMLLLLLRKK